MVDETGREKARKELLNKIEKEIGKGLIHRLAREAAVKKYEVVSSGSLSLDLALGVMGFPKGRIVEIFGMPSSGKSLISLSTIAEAQKQGELCALVDAEHAFDPRWATALGVDVSKLDLIDFGCGEEAFQIIDRAVRAGVYGVIVVDSVAGLVPKAEIEGEIGDAHMALQARMMGQALRILTQTIDKSKTILIFINQLRDTMEQWGPKRTTPGGYALKFYSSIRLQVTIKGGSTIKGPSGVPIGHSIAAEVAKNKCAPPHLTAEVPINYYKGVEKIAELLNLGIRTGVIKQGGPTFTFENAKFNGRDKLKVAIESDPVLQDNLKQAIIKKSLESTGFDSIITKEEDEDSVQDDKESSQ
jgi:recombination protein RecA